MLRRRFLAASSIALAKAAFGTGRRPNVLFIGVDDLRPQLGCYGHLRIQSPNIDKLASQGLRFDRAYCQQAVCAPTRASLLTGTRPDTTRVYDLETPLNTVRPDLVSLPHHFRNHGYETISLGKIYHHGNEDPRAWSSPPWRVKGTQGDDHWRYRDPLSLMAVRQNDAVLRAAYERNLKSGHKVPPPAYGRGFAYEGPDVPDSAYPDANTCDRAIEELRRLKDKSFFLAAGFIRPHLPFNAPKKYWDLYSPEDIELPSRNNWPENMPPVAGSDWGELRSYVGISPKGPVSESTMRMLIHGYYASVSYMDAQVGRLLAELDRLGLRENTIVILWGDHGWKLGDYGAWCKHTNFELDTHVPLILSVSGQKHTGESTKALVEFVDIYPTLAEACGLEIPAQCEGISMMPLLDDPRRKWKTAAFSQYPRGPIMGYTMRTERWRYTEWITTQTGDVTARELYDQANGDVVSTNLVDLPEHASLVRELSAILDKGRGWRKVREQL